MPLLNNQLPWQGIGTTVALVLVALAFAVVGYAEWSSEAAFDRFLNASKPSGSDPHQPGEPLTPIQPHESRPAAASILTQNESERTQPPVWPHLCTP
jgi:hypothetical protein